MADPQDKLDRVFRALSDHTRRSILGELKRSSMTVMELAEHYDMSFQAVSKHLKVLERAELLSKEKQGRRFICHAKPDTLTDAIFWISHQHDFWKHNFNSLESFLNENKG